MPGYLFVPMKFSKQLATAIKTNVSQALAEDLGAGDVTAGIICESAVAEATILARQPMVMSGQPWVSETFSQMAPEISIDWEYEDGNHINENTEICVIRGAARAILGAERTALNFLQLLSATATLTSQYVAAVAGTSAKVLDTRKTIPGLRQAQKYAVRCGGGDNHRLGLYDAILLKENHIMSAGGIAEAISEARRHEKNGSIEIEVESISEMRTALTANVDRILLDNFNIKELQEAVEINEREGIPPAALEASGGITLDNIRSIAKTGIDYISVGALTKNIKAIDLSMRFRFAKPDADLGSQ